MAVKVLNWRLLLSLLCSAGSDGCDPGPIELAEPSGSQEVAKGAFTVVAKVDLADSVLADSLGWAQGVPGAEVRLLRNGTAQWLEARTDSTGAIKIDRLVTGLYRLYAGRTLTAREAARVGGVVRSFADGLTLSLGSQTVELQLHADRPESLVISEIGTGVPAPWETGGTGYLDGTYWEVYNNGSTTLYLDGLVFGHTFRQGFMDTDHTSCEASKPLRTDSSGLYVRNALAFPGSGSEYPIGPGEVRLVASSAIDHRPVHPNLPDLRRADFEVGGLANANNPAVPDMLDISLEPWQPVYLSGSTEVYFLSAPMDLHNLTPVYRHNDGREYPRVPARNLIDVTAFTTVWPERNEARPPCQPMIHRRFDRYEGGFVEIGFNFVVDASYSLQRRVLRTHASGSSILQNTNTSAYDFVFAPRTPGWVSTVP